jgi:hypothetical protein
MIGIFKFPNMTWQNFFKNLWAFLERIIAKEAPSRGGKKEKGARPPKKPF